MLNIRLVHFPFVSPIYCFAFELWTAPQEPLRGKKIPQRIEQLKSWSQFATKIRGTTPNYALELQSHAEILSSYRSSFKSLRLVCSGIHGKGTVVAGE